MASGKTIIAHSFITIKEVLIHNEDALLVNPSDQKHLELTLEQVLKEKSDRFGDKARNKVFNFFTWDIRAKKIIKFLKDA